MLGKIHNESCLATMGKLQDNYIDLTVTSPPYDNLRKYEGISWDEDVWKKVIRELYRVTKIGGVVVWVVGDATIEGSETGTSFKQTLWAMECGFNLHDTMIYQKDGPPLSHLRYEQKFDYMFIWAKGKPKCVNLIKEPCVHSGSKKNRRANPIINQSENYSIKTRDGITVVKETKIKGNIWYYGTGYGGTTTDKFAFAHPAVFPEELVLDHIMSWSNPNDVIYDPFAGSGTTLKMAELSERLWFGSEISEKYCAIANERLTMYQNRLF